MKKGYILGISCGYHDSAAALIDSSTGRVLGACEEERFTGIKHDSAFPTNTIDWLLSSNSITSDLIDVICFYETPTEKLDRISITTKRGGWKNFFNRQHILRRNKIQYSKTESLIKKLGNSNTKIIYLDHHLSHLAYSFYTSPFKNSALISVDGVGEWETTSLAFGDENNINKFLSTQFPNSLGMLYSSITAFLGFKPNEGEYKVMGLAPYGISATYVQQFNKLIKKTSNGYELNMEYFEFDWSDTHMFNEKLGMLFGIPNRLPDEPLTNAHKNIAAGLQFTYEQHFFSLLNRLHKTTKSDNLCLSGGCAYNGTANGKILSRTKFKNLYIPPAPSDAGSAIGCALHYYYNQNTTSNNTVRYNNTRPFMGPGYSNEDVMDALDKYDKDVYFERKLYEQIIDTVSDEITDGNVIGWFQGKMEFGARALGNRSILANPRDPQMKSRLNRMIKKREGFRPFAPIVRQEDSSKYFNYTDTVPYMNQVVKVRDEWVSELPAITHVDNSARIQTLTKNQNRHIYALLDKLEIKNKFPIVINTSFNLKDQTMVLTPEDAIKTFLNCEMDTLIIHNYIIKKKII
tara:strand:+ start:3109 stop:4833 length:1725 start_codon:yes stop_codon:yes gene_type:complete